MTYKLQPDKPRPLARCGSYVAPGRDARWSNGQINCLTGKAGFPPVSK